MRKTTIICAAIVLSGLVAVPSSWGAPPTGPDEAPSRRRPPPARLVSPQATQRGNLGTYCWSYTDGEWGVHTCADTSGHGWPRAAPRGCGGQGEDRVRLGAGAQRPQSAWLDAYSEERQSDRPRPRRRLPLASGTHPGRRDHRMGGSFPVAGPRRTLLPRCVRRVAR